MKIFKYKDTSKYNIFDRNRILEGVKIVGGGVIVFQILLIVKFFKIYNFVPVKYIYLFLVVDIIYFIYKSYIIGYLNAAESYNDLILQADKVEKSDSIIIKQTIIKQYTKNKPRSFITKIKDYNKLNSASKWYVDEGVSIGDIILLNYDNGKSLCLKETEYLRQCGLPEDYYVIAVKDTYWLCCRAEEEWIYAFSKTLGLTHSKYQSLYEYIIEACNLQFAKETGN